MKITFAKLWFLMFKEFNFRIMVYCLCSVPAIPVARKGGCSTEWELGWAIQYLLTGQYVAPHFTNSPCSALLWWQNYLFPLGYLKVLSSVMSEHFANIYLFIFAALQGEKVALEPFYHPIYKAVPKYVCILSVDSWALGVMEHSTSLKRKSYQLQLNVCQTLPKLVPNLASQWDSSQLV